MNVATPVMQIKHVEINLQINPKIWYLRLTHTEMTIFLIMSYLSLNHFSL